MGSTTILKSVAQGNQAIDEKVQDTLLCPWLWPWVCQGRIDWDAIRIWYWLLIMSLINCENCWWARYDADSEQRFVVWIYGVHYRIYWSLVEFVPWPTLGVSIVKPAIVLEYSGFRSTTVLLLGRCGKTGIRTSAWYQLYVEATRRNLCLDKITAPCWYWSPTRHVPGNTVST
jgi:hypothetical protein